MVMTKGKLIRSIDSDRVKRAIEEAEDQTSGEIVVSVAPYFWGSIDKVARRAFVRLGVDRTRSRNGVLFFIVPSRRLFAVIGDQGIHEKVGQDFWNSVASHLERHFKEGDFTEGLVHGIAEVGRQLTVHFPYDRSADVNELTDDVDFGGSR
jgi:uncharacterized membrane protein